MNYFIKDDGLDLDLDGLGTKIFCKKHVTSCRVNWKIISRAQFSHWEKNWLYGLNLTTKLYTTKNKRK